MSSADRRWLRADPERVRAVARRLIGVDDAPLADCLATAQRHRVHLLLAASMTADERQTKEGAALARELRAAAALDARRQQDTRQVIDAFAAAGIDALILKGTALAY